MSTEAAVAPVRIPQEVGRVNISLDLSDGTRLYARNGEGIIVEVYRANNGPVYVIDPLVVNGLAKFEDGDKSGFVDFRCEITPDIDDIDNIKRFPKFVSEDLEKLVSQLGNQASTLCVVNAPRGVWATSFYHVYEGVLLKLEYTFY